MSKSVMRVALAAAICLPASGFAAESAKIAEIEQKIEEMRKQYESRIRALEQRVEQAESRAAEAEATAAKTETKVAEVEGKVETKPRTGDNSFNPAISLVLQGGWTNYSKDPDEVQLQGLPLGGEAGLQSEGFSLWETELTASANVDNLFYGQATIGLHEDDGETEVDVEEAFIDTLALPAGFGIRFGRFYSGIGYLNKRHTHTWDFADAPLAYQAFLGSQYRDDGVRASWVAPIDSVFLEFGFEALRGDTYPGGGNQDDFGAVRNYFAKVGGDVGQNNSWQLGLSYMDIDVDAREAGGHGHGHDDDGPSSSFTGDSDLTAIDAVWKTALGGDRALTFQGEYFFRDEDGQVTFSEDAGDALFNYDGDHDGWYLQGVYQFNRQWRAGLRYDRLTADNDLAIISNATGESDDDILDESGFQSGNHDPDRWAAMIDWSPSEFSRLRLQYARDNAREGADDQVFLQYIMTLGAHGAHQY